MVSSDSIKRKSDFLKIGQVKKLTQKKLLIAINFLSLQLVNQDYCHQYLPTRMLN